MVSEEYRVFQKQMAEALAAAPPPETLADRRARMETGMGSLPLAPGVEADQLDADGVAVVRCRRAEAVDDPVVLYFHGGGYRLGSARTYRAYGSRLALAAAATVILVDYRLAPEHRFPAAVEDALRSWQWLLSTGVAPGRSVVAGDSAGGGLAAALLVAARERGLPLPAGAVCLSPWADLRNQSASYARCADSDELFSKQSADEAAALYLDGADPAHPLASPALAAWDGLPPLLIQASSDEVLADDATALARAARAGGVDVERHEWDGMPHVWQLHYPAFPEAVEAVRQVARFVARVTAGT
ncbi:MAG: alpha/beta hydrolase [Actinomycetota bacterium]|nr:alpha/beta hydrolase [Actinomycetota bacterium]